MVELHSGVRWLLLLSAVAALVGYGRALARTTFDDVAARLGTVYSIVFGVQFLIGLVLYVTQSRWDGENVFYSYIHPLVMLLAIGVASAGVARARRTRSATTGLVAVVVSLLLVLVAIPW